MQVADARAQRTFDLRSLGALVLSLGLTFGAAALGGLATTPGFYETLERPSWAPPGWVFGPVWTVLYVLMALAAFWVWRARGWRGARAALAAYGVQLALNAAWTPIFFGLREPTWALIELALLWVAVLVTIVLFARVRVGAAALLVPYFAWITFAGALNWRLAVLN